MDLLFYNGIIHSVDNSDNIYDAIGIKNGKIAFLGSNEEASKIDSKKRINLENKLMLPGFMDTHIHLMYYALSKDSVDLSSCSSVEEIIEKSKSFLSEKGTSLGWLTGRGWNQNNFTGTKRFLTKHDLDKISTEYPIACHRVCGHLVSVNTLALEKVLSLEESESLKDYIDEENGILRESAVMLLNKLMDDVTIEDLKNWIVQSQQDLNKHGITTVHSADFIGLEEDIWEEIIKAYKELEKENKMTVKVYEQCMFLDKNNIDDFIQKGYKTGQGSSLFKIGPLKLILDGSLGAKTAAMIEPYSDDNSTCGILNFSKDQLKEIVKKAYDNNLQVAVHGIGDRAIEMIIDTYSELDKLYPKKDRRNGVVHAQFTNQELLEKLAKNNILAYIQPIFINDDMPIVQTRVGKERMNKIYAWKSMRDMNIHTTGSSDAPIASFSVLENIYCATTRKNLKGKPDDGWLANEILTVDEAVRLFTTDSAYASFEEDKKGSLEIGKCADLVVLDKNIYEIDPNDIINTNVLMTVLDGKIVFNK